jgi:peptidyl-prolyl cis-trans isomerase D
MSLLDKMRSGSDSTWMQVILAAVVVSFVWFGGIGGNSNDQGQVVARVNGKSITESEFARAYRAQESQQERALQRALSDEEREDLRKRVRDALVEQEVLLQAAQRLGIEVSGDEIARIIVNNPVYQTEGGAFEHQLYLDALKARGFTEGSYEALLREQLLIEKLRRGVILAVDVSDRDVHDRFVEQESRMELEFVSVAPADFSDDVDVSADAVAKYLGENKASVEETYKQDFERLYNLPEKVKLSVLRLAVRDDGVSAADLQKRLEGWKAEIDGGADFATIAARGSEDPSAANGGAMNEIAVSALDAAAAAAIPSLQPGQWSTVIVDEKQVRLFRLDSRTPARQVPLEEVQNDIATKLLREAESPKLAASFAEKALEAWKTGNAPTDLFDAQSLTLKNTGSIPYAGTGKPSDPPKTMLEEARIAAPGLLPKVYEANGVLYLGRLVSRTTPDESKFASAKADLRDQTLAERRGAFYESWIDGLVKSARVE